MRRYWYWPGWKGGNTKNRVGKGDKVLVLGDYLGSQKVGEGGELCPFHGSTSHLSSWLEKCMPSLFLKTLIGLQGCNKGGLSLVLELQEN